MIDFIISGQGLAGSMLAKELIREGASIKIIDPLPEVSSSIVAAGILHPITGRRIVKTWMADQLIPFAISEYDKIDTAVFNKTPLLEIFTSTQQRNEWMNRSAESSISSWIGETVKEVNVNGVHLPYGAIEIKNTGWLDVKLLTELARNSFSEKNIFINDVVSESDISYENGIVKWKNISAGRIIFCNGFRAATESMFSYLPFVPAKGEILEIHCPELTTDFILSKGIYIIPAGNDYFKVGSTFNWEDLKEEPSEEGRLQLVTALEKLISLPFKIINQYAAVRPANKDRRPFIGFHPQNSLAGIFNGLGTKGAMLAPWFARHFTKHLIYNEPLMPEVNIERYKKLLQE
ncbi:MAG: FAD-dependent oxidoreductase [Bacteroidota bacterium]